MNEKQAKIEILNLKENVLFHKVSTQEKNEIDEVILKRHDYPSIIKAFDSPDFRRLYHTLFAQIVINRWLKIIIETPFEIRVKKGIRYLHLNEKELIMNVFELGELPKIGNNKMDQIIIGKTKKLNMFYLFGVLEFSDIQDEDYKYSGGQSCLVNFNKIKPLKISDDRD